MTTPAAPSPPKLTEADVLDQVLAYLRLRGVDAQRRNTGGMVNARGQYVAFGQPGDPDIQGVLDDGRAFMCETKADNWKPRGRKQREHFARQVARLNRTNEAGGVGLLIDHPELLIRVWKYVISGATFHVRECGRMEITPKGGES